MAAPHHEAMLRDDLPDFCPLASRSCLRFSPPMSLWIKICGLKSEDAIDAAISAGADAIGLVHFPPTPRHLEIARMAELASHARGRIEIVALTVDANNGTVLALREYVRPDLLQLHGTEDIERIGFVRALSRLPVMKAVGIRDRDDLAAAQEATKAADRLLLDAKPPKDATRPGGNGEAFDWTLLRDLDVAVPAVLSGGLAPETVADAIAIARPDGVDVSSGVETAPGIKSPELIEAFVRTARDAEETIVAQPIPIGASSG